MTFWDTSALVPLLVEEPDSTRRAEQLGADPVLAAWWGTPVEGASAIERRLRDGALDRSGAKIARDRLARLAAAWHEVSPAPGLRQLTTRLLRTHPLRAADALQLASALSLAEAGVRDLRFACADTRLTEAAEIENLIVLP